MNSYPPTIHLAHFHHLTKVERSESEIQEDDREAIARAWGTDPVRVVQKVRRARKRSSGLHILRRSKTIVILLAQEMACFW